MLTCMDYFKINFFFFSFIIKGNNFINSGRVPNIIPIIDYINFLDISLTLKIFDST